MSSLKANHLSWTSAGLGIAIKALALQCALTIGTGSLILGLHAVATAQADAVHPAAQVIVLRADAGGSRFDGVAAVLAAEFRARPPQIMRHKGLVPDLFRGGLDWRINDLQ